jgi:hypothetical protein
MATSGDDASVRFLSTSDGRELGRVAVGEKPDAAIVSADGKTGFVMNAKAARYRSSTRQRCGRCALCSSSPALNMPR